MEQLESRRLLSAVYSVRDLGTLGVDEVHPHDINIKGQVVGWAKVANGDDHAFLWSKKTGIHDLHVPSWDGVLSNNPSTDGPSFALAINDHGMIAVKSAAQYSAFVVSQAFIYSHGVFTNISSPSHSNSPVDINNRGDLLMQGADETMSAAMVILKEGNQPARAVVRGDAYAINDHGMMIAYLAYDAAPISPRDKARIVDRAYAISDHAAVFYRWNHHQSSIIVQYGSSRQRFVDSFGDIHVGYEQINNHGIFVGTAAGGDALFGYVRDGNLLRDLNGLIPANSGWRILSADAINDKGQIAGEGLHNGLKRAYLLTPNPAAHFPPTAGATDLKLKPIKAIHHRAPAQGLAAAASGS